MEIFGRSFAHFFVFRRCARRRPATPRRLGGLPPTALLKWRTTGSTAGGCRVLLHPEWGTAVYPATLFARAPPAELREAMEAAARDEAR